MNFAVLFMLNADMYIEFFYQTGFQRYKGIKSATWYFTCSWIRQKFSS